MFHEELAQGRWKTFSTSEQLANIGSEMSRAFRWKEKSNVDRATLAVYRALELIDLTVADPKWRYRLKELLRTREVLCDYFFGENQYHLDPKMMEKEFYYYGVAARQRVNSGSRIV